MGVRKISDSKSDLKVMVLVSFDRPHDFLLVLHCNCVFILYHFLYYFRDIISYFPTFKEVTRPWMFPLRE